jgi:hypothetical protein
MHAAMRAHALAVCALCDFFYGKNWHGGKVTFFSPCTSHVRALLMGDARMAVDFFGCFLPFFTQMLRC